MATAIKIIKGTELVDKRELVLDFHLGNEGRLLLTGYVLTPIGGHLPNAAVEVKVLYKDQEMLYGVTFSDENGFYGISLPFEIGYVYELIAYSP